MKKAQAPEFLVMLLLATVGFIILLGVVGVFVSKLPDEASQQVCHASVVGRAEAALTVKTPADIDVRLKTVPLLCKTRDVKISGSKAQVEQNIADLMALCWWTFGEGKYDYTIEDFFSADTCFPCFTVTVNDIKNTPVIGYQEFSDWLRTHDDKKVNTTYYNYLVNFEGIQSFLAFSANIEPKQTYYIMYSDPKADVIGKHDVPNGIYFSNINNLPQTQGGYTIFGVPIPHSHTCTIIQGVEGQ